MSKAYSYVRFSSPEQAKGNSLDRQVALAADYAAKHSLELSTDTYEDLGVSAYTGTNAATGALAAFRSAVETGIVPSDSWLLVESLDRISRAYAIDAIFLLKQICDTGITVVTLNDDRKYTRELMQTDTTTILMSVMGFVLANEESTKKGKRVAAAWSAKRDKAVAENKPLTGLTVGWCQLSHDTKTVVPIPDRVAIVQDIYKDFLEGVGPELIARSLNIAGVPCWGRGKGEKVAAKWGSSYIRKILLNPAVIGRMTTHTLVRSATKKQRILQGTIDNYYPGVIDPITFERVQELLEAKGTKGRKVSQEVKNILSYLSKCPVCCSTMTRTNKGDNSTYLVCVKAKGGAGCVNKNIPYGKIEAALLHSIPLLLPAIKTDNEERQAIRLQIAKLEKDTAQRRTEIGRLIGLVKAGNGGDVTWIDDHQEEKSFRTVRDEIQILEIFIEGDANQIEMLEREYQKNNPRIVDEKFQSLLNSIKSGASLAEINTCMRGVFSSAVIDYNNKRVLLRFRHRDLVLPVDYDVPFKSIHNV